MTGKPPRVVLHAGMLAAFNIASVLVGFAVYAAVGARNQIATQLPIAVAVAVSIAQGGGFLADPTRHESART